MPLPRCLHFARMALAVEEDEALGPVAVRLFRANAIGLETEAVPERVKQPPGGGAPPPALTQLPELLVDLSMRYLLVSTERLWVSVYA